MWKNKPPCHRETGPLHAQSSRQSCLLPGDVSQEGLLPVFAGFSFHEIGNAMVFWNVEHFITTPTRILIPLQKRGGDRMWYVPCFWGGPEEDMGFCPSTLHRTPLRQSLTEPGPHCCSETGWPARSHDQAVFSL